MAQYEGVAVLEQHVERHLAAPAQQGRLRQLASAVLMDVGHPLDGGEQQFIALGGNARELCLVGGEIRQRRIEPADQSGFRPGPVQLRRQRLMAVNPASDVDDFGQCRIEIGIEEIIIRRTDVASFIRVPNVMTVGIKMQHVPYRGAGPAVTDMLGGHVQVIFDSMPSIIPHIRSGALRALAVTSSTRPSQLPDTPVIADTVPGYEASAPFGMGAPRNTPKAIVDKLNKETKAVLAEPAMTKQIVELGGDALIGTPEAFGTMIVAETEKWKTVIEGADIQKVEGGRSTAARFKLPLMTRTGLRRSLARLCRANLAERIEQPDDLANRDETY